MNTNTQPKVYVLLKNLPDGSKCGDNYVTLKTSDNVYKNDSREMKMKIPYSAVENNPEWFKEKQQPIEERICDEDIKAIARSYYSKLKLGIFFGENPKEIERDIEARVFDFYAGYKTALKQPLPNKSFQPESSIPTIERQEQDNHEKVSMPHTHLQEIESEYWRSRTTQPQDTKEDNPVVKSIPTFAEYLELHPVPKDFKENFVFWEKEMWDVYINTYWDKVRNKPKEEQSPVLFVTHDGVNVYGGEHLYSVDNKTWGILSDDCNNVREAILWNKGDDKIFSSKEAAEQYILENKPCLSFSEILEVLIVFDKNAAINKIKRIANTKINIQ